MSEHGIEEMRKQKTSKKGREIEKIRKLYLLLFTSLFSSVIFLAHPARNWKKREKLEWELELIHSTPLQVHGIHSFSSWLFMAVIIDDPPNIQV